MPTFKNRLVVELARNLNALFHLELSLLRGPVPDFEQSFDETRRQLKDDNEELHLLREELSKRTGQLTQARKQLSENQKVLSRERKLLLKGNNQLSKAQEKLRAKERWVEIRKMQIMSNPMLEATEFDEDLYSDIAGILDKIPADVGGGCSVSKAYVMAMLIREYDLKTTADIGVYRGRSLFPQALAHVRFTGGVVYGVDPWSAEEAREEDLGFADGERKEALDRFIEETDWQAICERVEALNKELGYADHCTLLRKTSAEAASYFEENEVSFDLVHVDGNHDTDKVAEDVGLYTARLRSGGFIVLDDISFKSVIPIYDELRSRMHLVYERLDQNYANDYAVFQNIPPSSDARYNKRIWAQDLW